MSPTGAIHRELVLPNPEQKASDRDPKRAPLTVASAHTSWLEIHRIAEGVVRFHLGAEGASEIEHTHRCLEEVAPGLVLGPATTCPLRSLRIADTRILRAVPSNGHHFWPMRLLNGSDRAGILVRSLASGNLRDTEVVLQVLFRRVPHWEWGFLTHSYDRFVAEKVPPNDRSLLTTVQRRKTEPAYHVEIRAAIQGPNPKPAEDALLGWVRSWSSVHGGLWWELKDVDAERHPEFLRALRDHDILRFAARKSRRDISATEIAQVLPIPWKDQHPGLTYAGAPALPPSGELVAPSADFVGTRVGYTGGVSVQLPPNWHHLTILGKTRSGKSTLALHVAGQLACNQPNATVVVLEPTGNLIRDLVDRLPAWVAKDAVEIDPARPAFERDGVEMATVPLNLLHLGDRPTVGTTELERRVERLSGDLLQAIRNAWGEDSIGGRGEFILRAVVQGLLTVQGTNLVDAYSALSDKKTLQRVERLASGVLLKTALGKHLSKLGYDFTFSSLDKLGKIATNPLLRKALCQRYHTVGFDRLLGHRLVLLNLAKSALGTEAATFLGSIFLTQLWSAIQELPHSEDSPIYLVIDEFHNFAIPAFADMLSEGARHGLHVVAITQYLSRIPDRIRSALVGNVDAWMMFPLGTEDMKEAFDLVQGARFGWKPDHLVGGLGPYQAAFATRGSLLKLDTWPPPRLPQHGAQNRALMEETMQRYARPEDSSVSPLDVSSPQVAEYLGAIPDGQKVRREELAAELAWTRPQVDAVTALCIASGYVEVRQDRDGGGLASRARGWFYREALTAARNEGEDHCDLLADTAAYLHSPGNRPRSPVMYGGVAVPHFGSWHHPGNSGAA